MKQLIVISQDREIQVVYNGAYIEIEESHSNSVPMKWYNTYIVKCVSYFSSYDMGHYKTKEKAQEVLDEILNRYLNGRKVYYLPKDDEDSKMERG